ncbi:MAG TPA: trigger factor [Burkholderiales bacterium]|nr:trigger factor [Burkholderiales bacterium]
MQSTVETLNHLERRLTMAVPVAEIEQKVDERLKRMARTVKMPGFRPGKVPLKMVAQQYGPQIRGEVVGDAVRQAFSEAVRGQNLRVAGYPQIEPKGDSASGHLEFFATFEVYPDVNPGDLSNVSIERPTLAVGDAEVDKTLEILRKQRVHFHEADKPAEDGDRVTIDFVGSIDGVEFNGGKGDNFPFVLGEGRMLKDFEAGVRGIRAGEEKTFLVQFPDDYGSAEVAGKTASFKVKASRVESPHLPEMDTAFAQSLGVPDGDLEKMRAEVKRNVEREAKRRLGAQVKQKVMEALLASTQVELPKALVQMEQEQLAKNAKEEMRRQGMNVEGIPFEPALFEDNAKRRVSLGLILNELVKRHKLEPTKEQVRAHIEEHSQSYEDPSEVIKWVYSQPERLAEFESLALEENVVDWVLKTAKVVDQPVAFDQLMGNAA